MQYIAFDAHKHYTWALVQDEKEKVLAEQRIDHILRSVIGLLGEVRARISGRCGDDRELVLDHR